MADAAGVNTSLATGQCERDTSDTLFGGGGNPIHHETSSQFGYFISLFTILHCSVFIYWSVQQLRRYRQHGLKLQDGQTEPVHRNLVLLQNISHDCLKWISLVNAAYTLLRLIFSHTVPTTKTELIFCFTQFLQLTSVLLSFRIAQNETSHKFSIEARKITHSAQLKVFWAVNFLIAVNRTCNLFLETNVTLKSVAFWNHLVQLLLNETLLILVIAYSPGFSKQTVEEEIKARNKKKHADDGTPEAKIFISKMSLKEKWCMLKPLLWPKSKKMRFYSLICLATLGSDRVLNLYENLINKSMVDGLEMKTEDNGEEKTSIRIEFHWEYIVMLVVIETLKYGVNSGLRSSLQRRVQEYCNRQLQMRLFEKFHSMSVKWHLDKKSYSCISKLQEPFGSIWYPLETFVVQIIPTWIDTAISLIYIVKTYNNQLGLILGITMISSIAIDVIFNELSKIRQKLNPYEEYSKFEKAIGSITNFEIVKYFNNEEYEAKRFQKMCDLKHQADNKFELTSQLFQICQNVLHDLSLMAVKLYVFLLMSKNQGITPGDFLFISGEVYSFSRPLQWFMYSYEDFRREIDQLEEVYEMLDLEPDVKDLPNAPDLKLTSGQLEFKNVTFQYDENSTVLSDVSFTVPGGTTLAIVGPSGSGKSTIGKLIFRFYDTTSGEICIDGQEIKTVKQSSLRQVLGAVPQETFLFDDTIANNILYGNTKNGTLDDAIEAAKKANIHEKINTFPENYDTDAGDRGMKLSGGERQRIVLARVLLKNPPILLLDEATSSLDTKTERQIQDSLLSACKNRTTIIIAHRLSTIVNADQIIVLKEGKIHESGTHSDLLQLEDGLYKSMWAEQFKENSENAISVD